MNSVQFKCGSSFLRIYYCSRLYHRWLNKVSWSNKVLWNCWFMTELLFQTLYFLNTRTFFKVFIRFRKELLFHKTLFLEQLIFNCWHCFHSYTFYLSFSNYNPPNTGVFRLKFPGGAQNGCTSQKKFVLILWRKILREIYFLRAALNRTIYRKI